MKTSYYYAKRVGKHDFLFAIKLLTNGLGISYNIKTKDEIWWFEINLIFFHFRYYP